MKHFKVTVRRNFKGTPFTPLMTREAKLQIERKVVEVLGELYGQYTQLSRLEDKDRVWLKQVGISIDRDPEHDAAGINDDWPIGRGVFINENKSFVVLVNFEDHLEFVILPEHKETMQGGLQRMTKLLQTFEKLGYATDPYLGNLTVSPKNLGTALKLEANISYEYKYDHVIDKDVASELEYGKSIQMMNRLGSSEKDIYIVTE